MSIKSDNFQGALSMSKALGKAAASKNQEMRLSEDNLLDLLAELNVEDWDEVPKGNRRALEEAFRKAYRDEHNSSPRVKDRAKREDIEEGLVDRTHPGYRASIHMPKASRRRRTRERQSGARAQLQRRSA